MNLADIDFEKLQEQVRPNHSPKPSVFSDEKFYYKVIHQISKESMAPRAYFTLEGLNSVWQGSNKLSIDSVGLIDAGVCPAFHDFIYDNDVCCGYIINRGNSVAHYKSNDTTKIKYIKYVSELATLSGNAGWGLVSVGLHNMIEYNGSLSFIDLDFSPIKLKHGYTLSAFEQAIWENEFRSPDGLYLEKIKNYI